MHQPLTTTNIALYKICVSHLSYLFKYLTIALTIFLSSGIACLQSQAPQTTAMTNKAILTDSTIISPQSNSKLIIQLPLHSSFFPDAKEQ